jgi:hypothetical protein
LHISRAPGAQEVRHIVRGAIEHGWFGRGRGRLQNGRSIRRYDH